MLYVKNDVEGVAAGWVGLLTQKFCKFFRADSCLVKKMFVECKKSARQSLCQVLEGRHSAKGLFADAKAAVWSLSSANMPLPSVFDTWQSPRFL